MCIRDRFNDNAYLMIASIGVTFVLLTGGIDISIASTIAFKCVFSAFLLRLGWTPLIVIPLVLLIGLAFGALMGYMIHYFKLQPFIVTLAGQFFMRGMCAVISTESIPISDEFYKTMALTTVTLLGGRIYFYVFIAIPVSYTHLDVYKRQAFQGMEDEGFKLLRKAADATGLKVVSEVISHDQIDTAAKYCDMFQVGARNMQNFRLLREIGRSKVPVLLKRGIASTIEEWLDAAEDIMSEGNYNVVLCERGIRTFETATRNTLDVSAVPVVKERSSLPIIIDPSHAAGKSRYIESLSLAGIAAGADGLIIDCLLYTSR